MAKDNLDLQLRRRRAGLKQEDLATELGVPQNRVSRFESGSGLLVKHDQENEMRRSRRAYREALDRLIAANVTSATVEEVAVD